MTLGPDHHAESNQRPNLASFSFVSIEPQQAAGNPGSRPCAPGLPRCVRARGGGARASAAPPGSLVDPPGLPWMTPACGAGAVCRAGQARAERAPGRAKGDDGETFSGRVRIWDRADILGRGLPPKHPFPPGAVIRPHFSLRNVFQKNDFGCLGTLRKPEQDVHGRGQSLVPWVLRRRRRARSRERRTLMRLPHSVTSHQRRLRFRLRS
jgi:hypothetical protein